MRTPSTSGSRGRANAHGPQVERTDRTMVLLRAILSTITTDRARALLVALAAWWHAVVALASSHSAAARVVADSAFDAADEHGHATTAAALVAAFTGVGASAVHDLACSEGESVEAVHLAQTALPMIDALLAELDAGSSPPTAPSAHPVEEIPFDAAPDAREAFARKLLEFAAEHDAEERLYKQDYAGCALRDAGRLLILASRVLDSATAAERRSS